MSIIKNGDYILVVAPEEYPGKKYRERYCPEHCLVYWRAYGIVPKEDEIIHHVDYNKHNNSIENLTLMKRREHNVLHGKDKLKTYVKLKCPSCGIIFIREKRRTHLTSKHGKYTCCSRKCSGFFSNTTGDKYTDGIKNMVIEVFKE